MDTLFEVSRALSITAFLGYGLACLLTTHMVEEFERFGLPRFRTMVGALQVLGALGLIAGYWYRPLLLVSAAGLMLLMLLGVGTRLRIRDSIVDTVPAFLFFLLNGFVLWYAAGIG